MSIQADDDDDDDDNDDDGDGDGDGELPLYNFHALTEGFTFAHHQASPTTPPQHLPLLNIAKSLLGSNAAPSAETQQQIRASGPSSCRENLWLHRYSPGSDPTSPAELSSAHVIKVCTFEWPLCTSHHRSFRTELHSCNHCSVLSSEKLS